MKPNLSLFKIWVIPPSTLVAEGFPSPGRSVQDETMWPQDNQIYRAIGRERQITGKKAPREKTLFPDQEMCESG